MSLTKEQWKEVEDQLSGPFGRVELRCDGYEITAEVKPLKALRSCIVVYVDGWIKGEWMRGGHEIPLKFHRETKVFIWPPKKRAEAKKKLLDRRLHKILRDLYQNMQKHTSMWEPMWLSPASFTRHIRKKCQSIELVKIGYGE